VVRQTARGAFQRLAQHAASGILVVAMAVVFVLPDPISQACDVRHRADHAS